jgi:hypothetical protein
MHGENLRDPAHKRRAGVMRQFPFGQLNSTTMVEYGKLPPVQPCGTSIRISFYGLMLAYAYSSTDTCVRRVSLKLKFKTKILGGPAGRELKMSY